MLDKNVIQQSINGDFNKQVTQGNNSIYIENDGYTNQSLNRAIRKCLQNIDEEEDFKGFITKLTEYMHPREEEVIGLEQKLINGNRQDLLYDAEFQKEKFAKKIIKGQLSKSVQNAYVHILACINSLFRSYVKPHLVNNKPNEIINTIIQKQIIDEIYNQICDLDIDLNMDDIFGMLYYLTGNCYINWEKNA